jgi:hypothetical protein
VLVAAQRGCLALIDDHATIEHNGLFGKGEREISLLLDQDDSRLLLLADADERIVQRIDDDWNFPI